MVWLLGEVTVHRPLTIRLEQRALVGRLPLPAPFPLRFEGLAVVAGADDHDPRGSGLGGWSLPVQHRLLASGHVRLGTGRVATPRRRADGWLELPGRRERLLFDDRGRIEQVADLLTGLPRWTFDHGDAGLTAVTDPRGRSWTVERDGRGQPTAVTSPDGAVASLAIDDDGWLERLVLPDGRVWRLRHDADGRIAELVDDRDRRHTAIHDDQGRLLRLDEPGLTSELVTTTADGTQRTTLVRSDGSESTVAVQRLEDGRVRRTRRCCGVAGTTVTESGRSGPVTTVHPDGTRVAHGVQRTEDPVWGVAATPVVERTVTTPAGRVRTIRRWRETGSTGDVEVLEVDGRRHERRWDATSRTLTSRTPAGRLRRVEHDAEGRPVRVTRPDGAVMVHEYGPDGQLTATTTGPHRVEFAAATAGSTEITDGSRRTTVRVDTDGAVQELADGRVLRADTDDDHAVELSLDDDLLGRFERLDPSAAGSRVRCVLPAVDGQEASVSVVLDARGRLTEITDDVGSVRYERTPGGTLERVETIDGTTRIESDESGRPTAVHAPNGTTVRVTRDGHLPLAVALEGQVEGTVELLRDGHRLAGYRVGGTEVPWQLDADGRVLRAGPVGLDHDPTTGRVLAHRCGVVTTHFLVDEHGRPAGRVVEADGDEVARFEVRRDDAGRRTWRRETVMGRTTEVAYAYDAAGRLVEVEGSTGTVWRAEHDGRGNRTMTVTATDRRDADHDARDRLVGHGEEVLRYDRGDRLVARTRGEHTTTYRYDGFGHLVGATTATGHTVSHVVDPRGRRVATAVDGQQQRRLQWLGGAVVASAGGPGSDGTVYVTAGGRTPLAMLRGGRTLAIVTDHLGSVRLVVEAGTGDVVQEATFDPDGVVVRDTAPGLHPFGFAGGLHDPTTGLVSFGAREYDPALARFTSRDPLLFAGGSSNLHQYANGDPVNRIDPSGTAAAPAGGGGGGGKVHICATDFIGGAEHGMIGIETGGGKGRLYGMDSTPEGGLQTQWTDQSRTHGNDSSLKCKEVPDVDPDCVMDQIRNPDGTYKETGPWGVDYFGQSETNPGVGANMCWNPVMEAIRQCGGDPHESIPTESTWDEVMAEWYEVMDASRRGSSLPAQAIDAVGSWFE